MRPHHSKPYRRRHIASLLLSVALVIGIAIEIGIVVAHNRQTAAPVNSTSPAASPATLQRIHSDYGYSFEADSTDFTISTTDHSATVRPKPGRISGAVSAAEFSVEVNPNTALLTALQQQAANAGLSAQQVAVQLFPASLSNEVDARVVSATADTLSAVPVYKTVYEFTSHHGGGKSYGIIWTGVKKQRAFAVKLTGLVGSATIPVAFAPLLDSLNISGDQAVLGAHTNIFTTPSVSADRKLDAKYLSDAVSPAVVQIFHTVCGVLTIDNQKLGDSSCASFSGSGFLTTANGYIATNGHVVVYSAKDAVASLVTSNDTVQRSYLRSLGLNDAQITATKADAAALAAQVAKIYNFSDDQLKFSDKGELTLVALGSEPPNLQQLINLKNSAQLAALRHDSDTIKQAQLIGSNYSSKDNYTTIADPKNGFSSSDVALLKINVTKAPAIPIATERVVQNQKIILMGFPGDAGNPLVDITQSDVTVTDGVVSAIRQAAGGKGKLYQSDADASHGNSGGPAIDDQGRVIGLLTYRYTNAEPGNATKSYIRDITDFTDLASAYNIRLNSHSSTQDAWLKGLESYSRSHYSAALTDFAVVHSAYPAHRLVASYIASAKTAIANGQDIRDLPLNILAVILLGALMALGGTIILIARHHGLHRVYTLSQASKLPSSSAKLLQ